MSKTEKEFFEELRKEFTSEAGEHLQTISSGLIEMEKKKDPAERQAVMESIFRAAHSLKGASRYVNLDGIGAVCQSVESVFSAVKKGVLTPVAADFDVLQRAVDIMVQMIESQTGEISLEVIEIVGQLDRIAALEKIEPLPWKPSEKTPDISSPPESEKLVSMPVAHAKPAAETIRISTEKIDSILLQAEELISIKLAAEQRLSELAEIMSAFGSWKKEREKTGAKTRNTRRLQGKQKNGNISLPSGAGTSSPPSESLGWSFSRMQELDVRLGALLATLQADRRASGILIDQLLEDTKTVLLQPFLTLLQTFPKMVRDISREQNKEVNLVFSGGEIEIDKRILEQMKDPFIHLLRNAIDHGLESTELRRTLLKAPAGTIKIEISQAEGNRIQILVSDDGGGIDVVKLRETAVKNGMLSKENADALDEQSALMLIFQSGISTSRIITDLSGRGLRMAIVQEAVDKLSGRISIETKKGVGTTFRISLPLTLATFHGMLLREYGQIFVVPMANVERAVRFRKEDVRTVENRETIMINGTPLSLVRLGAVLGIEPDVDAGEDSPFLSVLVLNSGSQRMAFSVQSLLHVQEILIKGLGRQLLRVRNISGATVLGSGKVVPVLNVADLFKSAVKVGQTVSASNASKEENQRKSILVVEDSITSRMLLKNILTSAGFDVHTTVDGVEAWTALKERNFNAVVSDVEMPRMNGFELTAKIRGDSNFAALPVVLVTSLESRQDRERGIEAGADAYIIKSSFDQSNLLDVVRRLI
jgi:two-component system chemotaxis sensor kinase CheA